MLKLAVFDLDGTLCPVGRAIAPDTLEKLRRLHQELNLLYELHPSLYGTDPFYHRYLVKDVLDAEFYTGCRYDFDKRVENAYNKLLLPL